MVARSAACFSDRSADRSAESRCELRDFARALGSNRDSHSSVKRRSVDGQRHVPGLVKRIRGQSAHKENCRNRDCRPKLPAPNDRDCSDRDWRHGRQCDCRKSPLRLPNSTWIPPGCRRTKSSVHIVSSFHFHFWEGRLPRHSAIVDGQETHLPCRCPAKIRKSFCINTLKDFNLVSRKSPEVELTTRSSHSDNTRVSGVSPSQRPFQ